MYRFYWQSGMTRQYFDSGGDPGELFYSMLRHIPTRNERSGDELILYNMRYSGNWHEVIRFDIIKRRKPYIDVRRLFDLRHDIVKFVRA